jgi:glycosyltransferase involved in cell wall biosynthesis
MTTDPITDVARRRPRGAAPIGRLKRVLFAMDLNPGEKFPTIAEHALTLARAFRDEGSLFLPLYVPPLSEALVSRHAEDGIRVESLDLRSYRTATLRRLLGLIRDGRIEVVHWNFYHPLLNSYVWLLTALAPRVEHYFTDHISRLADVASGGAGAAWKGRLKRPLLRRYRRALCVSRYIADEMRRRGWPDPRVVYNFVNVERYRPDPDGRREVRRSMGVEARFVALTVAYLIPAKGVDVAVRSMAALPEHVALWVVGGGPERENLEALARQLGLGSRVTFLGAPPTIVPFMQAADCFLCPSLWKEAAGSVNIEALACGLPVVASRIGGIPEFVEEGRTGLLFAPGDSAELADRIRRLAEDPPLRDRMGREARAAAAERYSAGRLLAEHLACYRVPRRDGGPRDDQTGG